METLLLAIFTTIFIATLLNIIFKRRNISHILGYILTGTIISYLFNFNTMKIISLDLVGEFGIVFLMFTIGLELSIEKIKKMKETLLINGALQLFLSVLIFFPLAYYAFQLDIVSAIIISLAFSLSSTAIVLPYLKDSKDIYTPYGKKTLGILIFQDISVIPILLLITFLSYGVSGSSDLSIVMVIIKTILALIFIVIFILYIGDKIVDAVLRFAGDTRVEEIFLGAIFAIVLGMAILMHSIGFTYSLGAFIAGVLIADTKYAIKVESDILSYKDLLLSIFFFSVGTKIDIIYLVSNLHMVLFIFILVGLLKVGIVYLIIKRKSDTNISMKTALALGQIGGFSFIIFDLAASNQLITQEMANFLFLITFVSMLVTPFILNNIYKLSSYFEKEFYESDVITPINKKDHIIIVGFGTLGRAVAKELHKKGIDFIIISDNLKHVLLARRINFLAYFGHLNKQPVMESLKVEESSSIIITMQSEHTKELISKAVIAYHNNANIIIKVDRDEEWKHYENIKNIDFIDSNYELSSRLVELSLQYKNT
ncbi:MAG: Glutathione-regulated potassium-efflux system protein KefB [uncultured Sulfurovum sp.]|uniref:Glutathione-regulated potassium-efflux system protein KefB n=1 Tax=uncultured Sulfurovum sp. TaxID=269237 RepID=A0A6S6TRY6_9BACT|nr:MAG: Glutathione-regulated potassium-efflux system protein KefB [uncultured Sulfurovum sp.]